ncbi:MAG: phage integrase SAM-like domain-containing protein [Saprospiraceae bacterium]|nr:phage integrase SAM-like domain-containing protein [Saprospiraceae bacterium]
MKHIFELKSKDRLKESSIRYRSYFNGERFVYGTGVKIYPELWDQDTQKPTKDKDRLREYKTEIPSLETILTNIEIRINNISNEVEGYLSNCRFNDQPINLMDLKARLDTNIRKSDKTIRKERPIRSKIEIDGVQIDKTLIRDYLRNFIYEIKNGSRTIATGKSKGNRYTLGTIKNYSGLLEQLKRFETLKKKKLKWTDLSIPFYEGFLLYCNSNKLSKNFIGRLIKQLKVIAQAAMDEAIHSNRIFRDKRFETLSERVMNIALTKEDLSTIYEMDLSGKSNLDYIRDLFLIGCYTAQRWGDYSKINKSQIHGNLIDLIQEKTTDRVVIPIKPSLRKILNKYPNGLPKTTEQTFNRKIKEIAEIAGFTEIINIKETRGGITEVNAYSKSELISSHTARRTAATLMFKEGIPPISIMILTGHKTESSFMKYIKVTEEENASILANHSYFNS